MYEQGGSIRAQENRRAAAHRSVQACILLVRSSFVTLKLKIQSNLRLTTITDIECFLENHVSAISEPSLQI